MLNRKKQTVFSVLFLCILLMAISLSFQSFKYEAKSKILLLQHNGEATDPYTAAKSSQFISSLLAQVVTSNSFLNDVFESGFNIDETYFGDNLNTRLKKWEKTAEARAINDTGIIEINIYHTDKSQSEQINSAIINIIKTKNGSYYGRTEDISIKVINEPIVSAWPVRPNILLNLFLTIFLSFMISFSFIVLFPDEKYNLSVWPKRKKKEKIVVTEKINFADKMNEEKPMNKVEFAPKVDAFTERGDIKNIFDQSNTK